jgi:hypothetical protein
VTKFILVDMPEIAEAAFYIFRSNQSDEEFNRIL